MSRFRAIDRTMGVHRLGRSEKQRPKHTFVVKFDGWREAVLVHSTQPLPWVVKARSQRRSKAARTSRKVNR